MKKEKKPQVKINWWGLIGGAIGFFIGGLLLTMLVRLFLRQ